MLYALWSIMFLLLLLLLLFFVVVVVCCCCCFLFVFVFLGFSPCYNSKTVRFGHVNRQCLKIIGLE